MNRSLLSPRLLVSFLPLFATSLPLFADGESPHNTAKSAAMEYGPAMATTVAMQNSKGFADLNRVVIKGLTVQLRIDEKVVGAAAFDTMLCRWAGAWLADEGKTPLKLIGTPFDGSHGTCPQARGTPFFQTSPVPGWTKDGKLDDPRSNPYVPLARDFAHYSGYHVSGDKVVVSYDMQGTAVREMMEARSHEGIQWCDRILELSPSKAPMTFVVCDAPATTNTTGTDGAAEFSETNRTTLAFGTSSEGKSPGAWKIIGKQLCLELPALQKPARIRVSLWNGASETRPAIDAWKKALGENIPDLKFPTLKSPERYPQTVVTQGKLGASGSAYEVDTLTLPDENPWNAWMRPTGLDFFKDGKRAAICTWSGDVWIVSGVDASLAKLEWKRVATGLFQPLGLKIVDDRIYVLGRDQITRLNDLNGDGEADFYENFNNDISCTPNYHEFAADLHTDLAGHFYFCKNSPLKGSYNWDTQSPHNGCMVRVSKDGSKLDVIATGLRATNGCGVGPNGEITNADNEGIWTPVSRLNWVGSTNKPSPPLPPFFGALGMDHRAEPPTTFDPPLCWLPWGMDNSPGGQVWASAKFGPLSGALLHLSYGKCAIFQVLREEVGGINQGGISKVPAAFASGAMRGRVNPVDGQVYVCGLRGWQTTAAKDGCLQRLRYSGKPFHSVTGLHIRKNTIEITASTPLDPALAADPESWDVQWWNYRWSKNYGSDLYAVSDPGKSLGKRGQLKGEAAPVKSIRVSPDGKTVSLEIPDLAPVMQVITRANLKTATGEPFKVDVAHTINKVP